MTKLNKKTTLAAGLLLLALSGCSVFRQPTPGTPLADVTARLGKPNAVYPDPDGSPSDDQPGPTSSDAGRPGAGHGCAVAAAGRPVRAAVPPSAAAGRAAGGGGGRARPAGRKLSGTGRRPGARIPRPADGPVP